MKIRILDDSIRLRLTRGEVERVGKGDVVEGATRFPGGATFRYALERAEVADPSARFEQGRIAVLLPHAVAQAWADGNDVGIEARPALEGAQTLRLLIEKDFKCLAPRDGEDDTDAFEHPLAGETQC